MAAETIVHIVEGEYICRSIYIQYKKTYAI